MNSTKRLSVIEALLFVTGEEGLSMEQLVHILDEPEAQIQEGLSQLSQTLEQESRGLELTIVANRYKLVTKRDVSEYIKRLIENPRPVSLSQAALETLAIIAYKQPISRAEIEDVRGVKSEKAIQTLISKELVKEVGRAEGTGRAILYGVTERFLTHFGLKSLDELPVIKTDLKDVEEETNLFYENIQQTLFE
ncbi:SMC-Scp complex subunit ScpB [Pullulanibacillus sp. KACC 23026]|uniref:SMC-Scp complex subunit ScpB n=1 Tax=Pullulanibacillus sp. KACC 23026 TaxID=3028315 RepID=UPI0023B030DD|nr:SMC-Scp complex subunit ScpB [Pullulanibacillus sp. KACC 23026]WEG11433.1 SMC-Scp complex subunit ScpB [Pullulanibacillus sp. KACC 23026]